YICRVGHRLVTSAGAEGRYVTDIDVTIDPATRDVIRDVARQFAAVNGTLPNPLPEKYPTLAADARLSPLVTFYNAKAAPLAQRTVGRITAEITRQPNEAGESAMGDLIADAQLAATREAGAQIAFMNRGGMRADLRTDTGTVTYSDVFSIHPFGNGLITLSLTGQQIDDLLEQQWLPSSTMLQVSTGFSYEWDAAAPAGTKVDIAAIRLQGARIDPAQIYRVTVNEFLSQGGDGFLMLRAAPARVRGIIDVDALEQYIARNSPIGAPAMGRIIRRN
ncbi:MAG TPA: bifunctional metallophosphatase/5'-nucleotidase, partial [Povalibacter sp.]